MGEPAAETAPNSQTIRHELRTPVNHIIGYSEMLLEGADEIERPERFVALHEVIAAGRAMLLAITDCCERLAHEEPAVGLARLHTRLQPLVASVVQTAHTLAELAEREGPQAYSADLMKIAGAAVQLGDLAAGGVLHVATPPLPALAPLSAEDMAQHAAEPQGGRLLVVDDNGLNRDMLARRLEHLGYDVFHAVNGRQALELLRASPFDLVLLDLMMPELDGFSVLRIVKSDPKLREIPVIVLSALDDMENVVRAVDLGADDYLTKPFDPVLLRSRIRACLYKQQMRTMEGDLLRQVSEQRRRAKSLLDVVIPLGASLGVEKDFNRLLERIVVEAQNLCRADGGTLYLRDDDKLRFVIVRNGSLNIAMGGASGKDIPFSPLRLHEEGSDAEIHRYVVTHTALSGNTINIPDAYNADGFDFSGTREFDARTGYRTTSVLTIPLMDGANHLIGVLQLINATDEQGRVIPFDQDTQEMLRSLGTLAAAALSAYVREQQLRQEISALRIEIDQGKKQREVDEITGTSYFADLQQRARQLRGQPVVAPPAPSGPVRKVYSVNGQEIVVREQGPQRGRLLLLIHGWSSSWYALSPLLPFLSERYRCVAVDLPGFGESPRLSAEASIPAYADLLADLIRQLSPELPAVLVGHSMGGMISVRLALRHPEVVERMALICPTISGKLSYWINWFIAPITYLERSKVAGKITANLEPYLLNVTDRLMRPASFAERTGISEADYHRLRADARRPGQGRVRAECYLAMQQSDLQKELGTITTPALVIWGMEDNTVPLRDASAVDAEWPSAELIVLPRAGHWPHFENPEVTRRHIRSFLAKPIKLLKAGL